MIHLVTSTPPPTSVEKAGVVILLGRQAIVLVRPLDNSNEWLLPKGHIEEGETAPECAVREAAEETGALLHPISDSDFIKSTTRLVPASDKWPEENEVVKWYLGKAASLETSLGTDKRGIGIFTPLAALAKLTYEDHRKVLAHVIAGEDIL